MRWMCAQCILCIYVFVNLSMYVKRSSIFAILVNVDFFAVLRCCNTIHLDIWCGHILEVDTFLDGGRGVDS